MRATQELLAKRVFVPPLPRVGEGRGEGYARVAREASPCAPSPTRGERAGVRVTQELLAKRVLVPPLPRVGEGRGEGRSNFKARSQDVCPRTFWFTLVLNEDRECQ